MMHVSAVCVTSTQFSPGLTWHSWLLACLFYTFMGIGPDNSDNACAEAFHTQYGYRQKVVHGTDVVSILPSRLPPFPSCFNVPISELSTVFAPKYHVTCTFRSHCGLVEAKAPDYTTNLGLGTGLLPSRQVLRLKNQGSISVGRCCSEMCTHGTCPQRLPPDCFQSVY